jgi:hypothetical protein
MFRGSTKYLVRPRGFGTATDQDIAEAQVSGGILDRSRSAVK